MNRVHSFARVTVFLLGAIGAVFMAGCSGDSESKLAATQAVEEAGAAATGDDDDDAADDDAAAADAPAGDAEQPGADGDAADGDAGDAAADGDAEDTGAGDAAADGDAEDTAAGGDAAAEAAPQRIVSLNPTGTEMLFAVGAGDQVIAVDNFSYYPPEAPVVDDLFAFSPSIEMLAGLDPDLIVTQGPVEGLDALGIEVLELSAAATLDDVYAQIEQVGARTGHVGQAAEVVANMAADIEAVLASLPERNESLTFVHELDDTLYSVTSSTFIGHVYGLLGLENIADAADPDGEFFGYPQLNEEFIITADPDLIFLADTKCCAQSAATVAERPGWAELRAVAAGNVIELDDDIASRWGPRVVDLIQAVGEAVAAVDPVGAG